MFFRTCMTASRTSLLRSQRMMGTIWRTPSLTLTERAGSSNWVSLSYCFVFLFILCFLADLWIDKRSLIAVAWFPVISLLRFALFSLKTKCSMWLKGWHSFCMASSVVSQALNAFQSISPSPCVLFSLSLYFGDPTFLFLISSGSRSAWPVIFLLVLMFTLQEVCAFLLLIVEQVLGVTSY